MTYIELQFYDYLGNPIESVQSLVEQQSGSRYTVTAEDTIHPFGMLSSGSSFNAYYSIVGDKMIIHGGQQTGTPTVTEVYKLKLLSLTTSERVYTQFKFVTN